MGIKKPGRPLKVAAGETGRAGGTPNSRIANVCSHRRRRKLPESQQPSLIELGSIADHTFSRCNPLVSGVPPKDSIDVPHHIDNHQECSALS